MASKRVTQSCIDWAKLAERVPPHQKAQFLQFKSKSDLYMRAMMANPECPPAIDWNMYKSTVPVPGMVDEFKKQYESLKVPYPENPKVQELKSLEQEIQDLICKFKQESEARMAEYKKQLDHIQSLLPYDQMTMEDFKDAHPDQALDPINRPTFWPHTPEEQPGYVDKSAAAVEKH